MAQFQLFDSVKLTETIALSKGELAVNVAKFLHKDRRRLAFEGAIAV